MTGENSTKRKKSAKQIATTGQKINSQAAMKDSSE